MVNKGYALLDPRVREEDIAYPYRMLIEIWLISRYSFLHLQFVKAMDLKYYKQPRYDIYCVDLGLSDQ